MAHYGVQRLRPPVSRGEGQVGRSLHAVRGIGGFPSGHPRSRLAEVFCRVPRGGQLITCLHLLPGCSATVTPTPPWLGGLLLRERQSPWQAWGRSYLPQTKTPELCTVLCRVGEGVRRLSTQGSRETPRRGDREDFLVSNCKAIGKAERLQGRKVP